MSEKLLRTKLFAPPLRPSLVHRPHLIEKLNQGVQQGCRLTLISAPAGFGKTTLVSEWVGNLTLVATKENPTTNRIAWLSLDEHDNDPARFLAYFVTALHRSAGEERVVGEATLGMLQSTQQPPAKAVLTSLINDIATIQDRIVFVLDDYHLIDSSSIDDALTFLIEHSPPQLHLVVSTRDDPHLSLARLRARSHLTELRVADLRFSSSEAAEFLNQVMGLNLPADDIATLETRTEGWIAGLHLAAISMQGHSDSSSLIKAFTGSHRFVLDYLLEEVLEQHSERVQTFLLQTAVLNRLTGSLCNALTGQDNGQATLEWLERSNLFIIPLDNERLWYRYHHLFADLLRQRLGQTHREQIPLLNSRASEWHERNGLPSDAIRHAVAAEDFERAASLAELAWPAMSGSFQSIEWLSWLKALPDELVRARPVLCVGYAWAFLNSGNLEAAEVRLQDAERLLVPSANVGDQWETPLTRTCLERSRKMVVVDEDQFRSLPISLATARAYHAQAIGDVAGTVKYARRVLNLLPEGRHPRRGDATALLGLAQWASGDIEAALQTMSAGLAGMDPLDVIIGTFVLADMRMTLGQLHAAVRTCEHALRLAVEHGDPMPLGTEDVYTGISELHREQDNLEAALQDLLTSKQLGEQVELPDWQYRWCIARARLKETIGDLDGALDLLDEAENTYVRTPLPEVRPITAIRARVWIKQGRLVEALDWTRERSLSVADDLSYLREFEHIVLARMQIARYRSNPDANAIRETIGLLDRLLKAAEDGRRNGSVIEILVQQALAHAAQCNVPAALVPLERALSLAIPEGYVRVFVDEGPPMAALLQEAAKRGVASNYVRKLRASLVTAEAQTPGSQPLIEPLSQREMEILRLIAQGCSNREISERLFLALNTVKGHNRNIFGKLNVHRRTEAVARARGLGLL